MNISWAFFVNTNESTVRLDHEGGMSVLDLDYDSAGVKFTLKYGPQPSEDDLDALRDDFVLYDGSQYVPVKPRFMKR